MNLEIQSIEQKDNILSKGYFLIAATSEKSTSKREKNKSKPEKQRIHLGKIPNHIKRIIESSPLFAEFNANGGEYIHIHHQDAVYVVAGLGARDKLSKEHVRRNVASVIKKSIHLNLENLGVVVKSFHQHKDLNNESVIHIVTEAILLSHYQFNKYQRNAQDYRLKTVNYYFEKLDSKQKKAFTQVLTHTKNLCQSVNFCRDLINEAPNVLHSEKYAEVIQQDVKKHLSNVKVKILKKADLMKENMRLLLSVNNGSAYEPRLVHLTYTPKKKTKTMKHIAFVGKGITFDTGGYSLKPSASMMGMKFDMGGSATVYGAFRAAVLNESPHKMTCVLAITDNAVNSKATMPDSIVKARNGLTVEILNTDAEGRLILADALDYTCDLAPDYIIDSATLTGACLVALGSEVCGLMTNNEKMGTLLKKSAKNCDEYIWELPIIDEFRKDMKSKIADLKNIGSPMRAGTATAAAFLENFIKDGIPWCHLDIAGVGDSQKHLPYCPTQGASGLMVRTLHDFVFSAKA